MKVVIRKVRDEWQVATMYCGLYNTLVGCGSFAMAAQYAEENGMAWSKYQTCGEG